MARTATPLLGCLVSATALGARTAPKAPPPPTPSQAPPLPGEVNARGPEGLAEERPGVPRTVRFTAQTGARVFGHSAGKMFALDKGE